MSFTKPTELPVELGMWVVEPAAKYPAVKACWAPMLVAGGLGIRHSCVTSPLLLGLDLTWEAPYSPDLTCKDPCGLGLAQGYRSLTPLF